MASWGSVVSLLHNCVCGWFFLCFLLVCFSKPGPPPRAELQSARQARAPEGPSDWLDLVLPGNSLLQAEVGGGPEDGVQWAEQTKRLP